MTYELRYAGEIKTSENLEELQNFAKNLNCPYIIYEVIRSSLRAAMEEIDIFGDGGLESAVKWLARGHTINEMATRYHVSAWKIRKYINIWNEREKKKDP